MAGDWIKIEHWTPDKPEVFRIADLLGIDPDAVTGKLLRIWIWADQQTVDGNAVSVTQALLDRLAGVTGFADAMIRTGWLTKVEDGVQFVNFERHNGETAKKRGKTAKRVQKHRIAETQMKRKCNAASVTESAQTALPEKRREEKNNINKNSDAGFKSMFGDGGRSAFCEGVECPSHYDRPDFHAAWRKWKEYLASEHMKFMAFSQETEALMALHRTIGEIDAVIEAISYSIASGYKTIWAKRSDAPAALKRESMTPGQRRMAMLEESRRESV